MEWQQVQPLKNKHQATQNKPFSAMETVTDLQPIADRQEIEVLIQAGKFKRLHDLGPSDLKPHEHPTRRRLKRSDFI